MEQQGLKVFENSEFGQVRTIFEDGKVLFCAVDIARALGYSNPYDAIGRHCDGVVKREGSPSLQISMEYPLNRLI